MFKLEISTSNDAFDGSYRSLEVKEILLNVAHRVGDGYTDGVLKDSNGNTVGKFEFTED